MPEGQDALPERGTLLGFDFGLARTGVAVGELETRHAQPLETICCESNDERFARIAALVSEWSPVAMVVGVPQHPDGSSHALNKRCRRFANQLHGRFGLPVASVDESYSSAEAEERASVAAQHTGRQGRHMLDALAATVILQHYLDSPAHATTTR